MGRITPNVKLFLDTVCLIRNGKLVLSFLGHEFILTKHSTSEHYTPDIKELGIK